MRGDRVDTLWHSSGWNPLGNYKDALTRTANMDEPQNNPASWQEVGKRNAYYIPINIKLLRM